MFKVDQPEKQSLMYNFFCAMRKFLKITNRRSVISHDLRQADGNLHFQGYIIPDDRFNKSHVTTQPTLNAFEEQLLMNDDDNDDDAAEPDSTVFSDE